MKKNLVSISAVVLSACALAFGQAPPAAPAAAPKAAAGPPPIRIAIINVQQAILNTQEGRKAATELQAKFSPRKNVLEKRQTDIQALQDQLRKGGATMSDAAKEKIMRDIDSMNKSLQRDGDDLNSDAELENGKLMQELGGKLMSILDTYAAQNGYAVVMDVSNQQSPVFWADQSCVITADIVKLYDQQHPVSAAAKPPAPKPAAPPARPPAPPATKKQ